MLASSGIIRFEALRTLLYSSFEEDEFIAVGTPFVNPIRLLKIANTTNANVLISFDGVTAQDFVAANGFVLYDYTTNRGSVGGILEQPTGTRVYVSAEIYDVLPSSGSIYVTAVYASQV